MKSPGRLLLCGTHAYKPMCREYSYKVKITKYISQFNQVNSSTFDDVYTAVDPVPHMPTF
jgi:hypothetical protein